ncbi:bifunctional helix-turn-helix transcriptional regulator/GNAT family N-acetyltransferase [bacterium]|nr:bifunctional helix-turn-helix transcriptional regulator/GNAT family N-acetyltransferase [bacterium]
MQDNLAESTLSPSAVHAIIEIGNGTVSTANAAASLLKLEKSTVSRLFKGLQEKGLIELKVSKSDARFYTSKLTKNGWLKFHEIEDYARKQVGNSLTNASTKTTTTIVNGLVAYAEILRPTQENADKKQCISSPHIDFQSGYQPALLGRVTAMHASFYSKNYNFGLTFECKVATEMAEFLTRIDHPSNTVFSAYIDKKLVGSVSIDSAGIELGVAHLRWFIVDPAVQGHGIGKELISRAVTFADQHRFKQTHLWTFKGLDAARHLYESEGFRLVEEKAGSQWGREVLEQKFVRIKDN